MRFRSEGSFLKNIFFIGVSHRVVFDAYMNKYGVLLSPDKTAEMKKESGKRALVSWGG